MADTEMLQVSSALDGSNSEYLVMLHRRKNIKSE